MSASRIRSFRSASLLVAAFVLPTAGSGAALAFDHGCGGRAVECYEKVQLPDRYATVERPELVRPAYSEVVSTPPVIQRQSAVVEVVPAYAHTVTTPAVYGNVVQRVQVAPARVDYALSPAVVRTVQEQVVVKAGGTRWERSRGLFGRERLCKVATPAVVRTVTREVVVAPPRKTPIITPAVYQNVVRPVLVRPATARHVYVPAVRQLVTRDVVVAPAVHRVVRHPAVVGVERREVLVERGRTGWQRTGAGLLPVSCGRC